MKQCMYTYLDYSNIYFGVSANVGVLHFNGDIFSRRPQFRLVHLCQRSGAKWDGVYFTEYLIGLKNTFEQKAFRRFYTYRANRIILDFLTLTHVLFQVLSDHLVNLLQRRDRRLAVQHLQRVRVLFREEVFQRANVLSDLDVHAPVRAAQLQQQFRGFPVGL